MRGAAAMLLVLATLAACERQQGDGAGRPGATAREERIDCKVAGASTFEPACTVERVRRGGTETFVVHHPDGAFRRFVVLEDGRGLAVADGASQAATRYADGYAELVVDGDGYRFPFVVKAAPGDARAR